MPASSTLAGSMISYSLVVGRLNNPMKSAGGHYKIWGIYFVAGMVAMSVQTALAELIPPMQYFDELFITSIVAFSAFELMRVKNNLYLYSLVLVFLYLVLVSLIFGRGYGAIQQIYQVALHLKFFLIYLGFRVFLVGGDGVQIAGRVLVWVSSVTFVFLVLNWLVGPAFNEFFDRGVIERFGGSRITGIQLKQNDALILLSPVFILASYRIARERRLAIYIVLVAVFALLCILNTSRTASLALLLAILGLARVQLTWFVGFGTIASGLVGMAIVLFEERLRIVNTTFSQLGALYEIETTEYIRAIMLYYGSVLALENFPIGTGAGTFGTLTSMESPVYSDLGIAYMSFFQKFQGVFDSNIGSILGEFGYLGFFAFTMLVVLMIRDIVGVSRSVSPDYLLILLIMIHAVLVALANPFFSYQVTPITYIACLILSCNLEMSERQLQ